MLDFINQQILKQIYILGCKFDENGFIQIDFTEDTTEQQKELAYEIAANCYILSAKQEKIKEIDKDFESNTNQGWDSGQGFKLGLTTQDVSLLVGLFVLAKEGAVLGLEPPPIIDTDGNSHQLTMQELTMLMLQYGSARAELSKTYASRKKLVENATTIEELNNI